MRPTPRSPATNACIHISACALDAESIRDTLLFVGGNLDRTPGGPHPFPRNPTWGFTQHNPFKAVYDTNAAAST